MLFLFFLVRSRQGILLFGQQCYLVVNLPPFLVVYTLFLHPCSFVEYSYLFICFFEIRSCKILFGYRRGKDISSCSVSVHSLVIFQAAKIHREFIRASSVFGWWLRHCSLSTLFFSVKKRDSDIQTLYLVMRSIWNWFMHFSACFLYVICLLIEWILYLAS